MRKVLQSLSLFGKLSILLALLSVVLAQAQPVTLRSDQLDRLVARIALYPDPLLAQLLTASTYPDEIGPAAEWADQHSYLHGDELARAISEDQLPWDPSILGLLPFPSVLDMMRSDMAWTYQLGDAVLSQRPEVMDAIQRMRKKAKDFGYLQSNRYVKVVPSGAYIEILPVDPAYLYVPVYDPLVVFARPVGPVVVTTAITFGPPIFVGPFFLHFGWAPPALVWTSHSIVIDGRPWVRGWVGREAYVHPYRTPWVRPVGPRVEHHELRPVIHPHHR